MFDAAAILDGLSILMNWKSIVAIILGLIYGVITGGIPGFSTSLAIAVMLPVTFPLDPLTAIVFLTAIYAGGNFGSSISAILISIPGSPQAIVTSLDGYPMTQQGKSNEALGGALAASATGNLIGSFFLILIMPLFVTFALMFGPPELFLVSLVGLTLVATLHKSFLKSIIAGAFGVLIGTIGMTTTGTIRGTWGFPELMDGIPIIPALIGLIGFSEVFYLLQKEYIVDNDKRVNSKSENNVKRLLKGYKLTFKYPFSLLRSSVIGVIIGALPGAGASVASVVSYNEAKRFTKKPEKFGKGSPEGLLAAESANNASEGGALGTMLALGIPGGQATAVLIGALIMQGLIPGPRLFMDNEELVYGVMLAQFITTAFLLFVGLAVAYYASKVVNIPVTFLVPVISVLSIIGTYAVSRQMFDVYLMLIFAILGIILKRYDYPLIAVILGLILSPIIDSQFRRTYELFGYDFSIFFTRPISLGLLIILVISIIPIFIKLFRKTNMSN